MFEAKAPKTESEFRAICDAFEAHARALKPVRRLEKLSADLHATELRRYDAAYFAFREFHLREAHYFGKHRWPFPGVENFRRRADRLVWSGLGHKRELHDALIARGSEGVEAMRKLYFSADLEFQSMYGDTAARHFPDDAEPFFEAFIRQEGGDERVEACKEGFRTLLLMIHGYRAQGARPMAPELGGAAVTGLEPALARTAGSPAEYPELMTHHFIAQMQAGTATHQLACIEAWRSVGDELQLDPRYLAECESASFDLQLLSRMMGVVFEFNGNNWPAC